MGIGEIPAANLARYRELFGESEISDSAKDEKILLVARIMQAFVDAAHGITPTQLSITSLAIESSPSGRGHVTVFDQETTRSTSMAMPAE